MAGTKKDAAKGRGKGVAFAKWAKIDKAQRNMFVAVCIASIIIGITIVSIIYFAKVIAFNVKLMDEKASFIADYKETQDNLQLISDQVTELSENENLEVVARTRSDDCKALLEENSGVIDDVEVARTCTSLRVISDALPSAGNVEATLGSLNVLLIHDNDMLNIEGLSGDVSINTSSYDDDYSSVSSSAGGSTLNGIGASVSIDDTEENVRQALRAIENSIRNYDIVSAAIAWSSDAENGGTKLELNASFTAYYSRPVDLVVKTRKVCADATSESCTGKKRK